MAGEIIEEFDPRRLFFVTSTQGCPRKCYWEGVRFRRYADGSGDAEPPTRVIVEASQEDAYRHIDGALAAERDELARKLGERTERLTAAEAENDRLKRELAAAQQRLNLYTYSAAGAGP
jgi:hypothetical protein